MGNQSLDHAEILMVRWAHDDPNPIAQDSIERADKDALAALMRAKGIRVESAAFEYPMGYDLPDAKRLKLSNGADVDTALEYPNTDNQYTQAQPAATSEEEYAKYYQQYTGETLGTTEGSVSVTESATSVSTPLVSSHWTAHVDDDSGATYFHNDATGESSWTRPEGFAA
jgi:hypothetical protein